MFYNDALVVLAVALLSLPLSAGEVVVRRLPEPNWFWVRVVLMTAATCLMVPLLLALMITITVIIKERSDGRAPPLGEVLPFFGRVALQSLPASAFVVFMGLVIYLTRAVPEMRSAKSPPRAERMAANRR